MPRQTWQTTWKPRRTFCMLPPSSSHGVGTRGRRTRSAQRPDWPRRSGPLHVARIRVRDPRRSRRFATAVPHLSVACAGRNLLVQVVVQLQLLLVAPQQIEMRFRSARRAPARTEVDARRGSHLSFSSQAPRMRTAQQHQQNGQTITCSTRSEATSRSSPPHPRPPPLAPRPPCHPREPHMQHNRCTPPTQTQLRSPPPKQKIRTTRKANAARPSIAYALPAHASRLRPSPTAKDDAYALLCAQGTAKRAHLELGARKNAMAPGLLPDGAPHLGGVSIAIRDFNDSIRLKSIAQRHTSIAQRHTSIAQRHTWIVTALYS